MLASGGADGSVWLWDVSTGRAIRRMDGGYYQNVSMLSFSPDGRLLAGQGEGPRHPHILLWDTATGRIAGRLWRKEYDVRFWTVFSAVFSPDGKQLAAASDPQNKTTEVHIFDLTGKQRVARHAWRVAGERQPVVRFSPAGKELVVGRRGEALIRHDVKTGRNRGVAEAAPIVPKELAEHVLARQGKLLAARAANDSGRSTIQVVDGATGKERFAIERAGERPDTLVFSGDGKTLAGTDSWSGKIRLWDVGTGREKLGPSGPERVIRHVYFDAAGQPIAVGVEDGEVRFWNVRSGKVVRRLRPARGRVELRGCLALSPDGSWLAACGLAPAPWQGLGRPATIVQTTRLWRLDTGKEAHVWIERCADDPWVRRSRPGWHDKPEWSRYDRPALVFSPNSRLLAEVDRGGTLRVREVASGKEVCEEGRRRAEDTGPLYSDPFWSPDSKELAVTARFPTLVGLSGDGGDPRNGPRVLDVATRKVRREGPSFRDPRWLSPDKSVKVVLGRHISLADARTGKRFEIRTILHDYAVVPPVFSPSSRLLAVGDTPRGRVRLHEVSTGEEIGSFSGHTGEVSSLTFSRDGKLLLSGSVDGTAVLWDVAAVLGAKGR
jgi:WD40 repeat protein